jgi:hypothetical protein
VVRDSIASGNNGTNNTSVHFSYDSISTVGVNWGYEPTIGVSATDSMRIESDNITYELRYTPPFASVGNMLMHSYSYIYSVNLNPLYNQAFARSLGCTLFFQGFEDFRSKNLPANGVKTDFYTNSGVELQYTWTTDSVGRVIQGVALDEHSNVYQIYSYKY